MLLQVFAHGETLDPLVAEDGLHGGVRGEELLVLGILKVRLLQVRPQPLDNLREKIISNRVFEIKLVVVPEVWRFSLPCPSR